MNYSNDYEPVRFGACSDPSCKNPEKNYTVVSDHHILRQDKINKKAYPEYIHRRDNLKKSICNKCHENAPNQNEVEFCRERRLYPRTKAGIVDWQKFGGWDIG